MFQGPFLCLLSYYFSPSSCRTRWSRMISKAEPSFRINHQKWQTGPLPLFQEHTHTLYLCTYCYTHIWREKELYNTSAVHFHKPSWDQSCNIEACGESPGTSTGSEREKRSTLSEAQNTRPGMPRSFQHGELPENVSTKCFLLEPQTPHMPLPHPYTELDIWRGSQIELYNAHRQKEQKKSFISIKAEITMYYKGMGLGVYVPTSTLPFWIRVSSWIKLRQKSPPCRVAVRAPDVHCKVWVAKDTAHSSCSLFSHLPAFLFPPQPWLMKQGFPPSKQNQLSPTIHPVAGS